MIYALIKANILYISIVVDDKLDIQYICLTLHGFD